MKNINILMNCNKKFLFGFKGTLFSLLKTTDSHITLFLSGLSIDEVKNIFFIKKNIKIGKLKIVDVNHLLDKYHSKFKPFVRDRFPMVSIDRVISVFAIVNIDKLLYLDSDLIINKNIDSLYDCLDDKNSIVAIGDFENSQRYSNILKTPYFNSGVLLFNLNKIRKKYSLDGVFEILKGNNEIYFPDQDILNLLIKDDKKIVDFVYNNQLRDDTFLKKNDLKNKNIIHFVGMPKPWMHRYHNLSVASFYWHSIEKKYLIFQYPWFCLFHFIFKILVKINHIRKRVFKYGK